MVRKQEHGVDLRAAECAFVHLLTEPYASVDIHKKLRFGTDGTQRISEGH